MAIVILIVICGILIGLMGKGFLVILKDLDPD